jgi:hypothetical protein
MRGGRAPSVAGGFGAKPDPVTVIVSPAGSRPCVFETDTVGGGGAVSAAADSWGATVRARAKVRAPASATANGRRRERVCTG